MTQRASRAWPSDSASWEAYDFFFSRRMESISFIKGTEQCYIEGLRDPGDTGVGAGRGGSVSGRRGAGHLGREESTFERRYSRGGVGCDGSCNVGIKTSGNVEVPGLAAGRTSAAEVIPVRTDFKAALQQSRQVCCLKWHRVSGTVPFQTANLETKVQSGPTYLICPQ